MVRFMKWSFQDDFVEIAFGAVLRTPGLILCDYWHQKCLEYSIPKSLEFTDFTDASLHLAVLLMVRINIEILVEIVIMEKHFLLFRDFIFFCYHMNIWSNSICI